MIIGFGINWFGSSNLDGSFHEVRLIIVVDCCISILFFIEFDKRKSSNLLSHMIFWNFYGFDLSKSVEECIQIIGSDVGWKVAHINGSFEIVFILVHHSLIY